MFCCTVEHGKVLSILSGISGNRSACISHDMGRNRRRRIIREYKNNAIDVIYNYGILSTGFDVPDIKAIIIARPTSSIVLYSQMIGRGLRGVMLGGTNKCSLIDIKDNFLNFGGIDEVYKVFDEYWT